MVKILFICHGNICRSPMAEFIMRDLVRKEGLEDYYVIASAAVSREEIGNPVYPPAVRLLKAHGIDCRGHHAMQMTRADYDAYDYLIGMDSDNIIRIRRIIGDDPQGKVSKLLSFAGIDRDVADPWYTGGFAEAFDDILKGCQALLEKTRPF